MANKNELDEFDIKDYVSLVDFDGGPTEESSAGDTGRYYPGQSAPKKGGSQKKVKQKAPLGLRILKKLLIFLIYLIIIVLAAYFLASAGWRWANDLLALDKEEATATIVLDESLFTEEESTDEDGNPTVVTTADMDQVAAELHESGLIEYEWLFKLFAQFTHKDTKLIAGTYELNTDMDYSALLRNMSAKSSTRATVTLMVPEGYTVDEIIELLAANGVAEESELQDAAANYDFDYDFLDSSTLGDEHRLEGFLFPDTYEFYQNSDAATALNRMLSNFEQKYTESMQEKAAELGYSTQEILIVASIIEKETDGLDQADIASVIYNRLNNSSVTGGYLQMDSTIQYILDERKDTLDAEDLAIDSPYNTYLYAGLPAGPICNPGMRAIEAALEPNQTDYYYFYLGDDGSTHFFNDYDSFVAFGNAQTGVTEEESYEEIVED